MIMSFVLAVIITYATIVIAARKWRKPGMEKSGFLLFSVLLFTVAFALRIFIGYSAEGFTTDMDAFKAWARITNEVGFARIYREDIFLDYPPGYLYILVFLEKIRLFFGIGAGTPLFSLILKIPSILGDIFCAAVLLIYAKKKMGEKSALFVSGVYLFCPAVIVNSAQWGQADSFCAAVFLGSMLLLYHEKYIPSAALYGLSIILKPQMLAFVPVYLFIVMKKRKYRYLVIGPLVAIAVIILVATPFTQDFNYLWLVNKYKDTINFYNYYSVNAYNFWTLLGKNWEGVPGGFQGTLLNIVAPFLATALCGLLVWKSKRDNVIFACPFIILATVYMFMVKIHERYLFHALIFLLLAYVFVKDIRLMYSFALTALTHYINVAYVLNLYSESGGNYDANETAVRVLSALQLLTYAYMLYVTYSVYIRGKEIPPREANPWKAITQKEAASRMTRRDVISMLAVTLTYGIVAFWALGAHETAVTPWTPAQGEEVILASETEGDTLCYIAGIAPDNEHYGARVQVKVSVETSMDGQTWADAGELEETGVFSWKMQGLEEPAKFIKIKANDNQIAINEIALKKAGKESYEKLTLISGRGEALIDEQDVVPVYPTYYHSTYFDEIYHVRTAYEHILRLEPYESTHPPLGKLIIALGIRIFGMNPFGWRFMGTLFGILMLPCLYHLLKQLLGKTALCTAGTILFAFDFMHFTQTRIATIDTYAVLFILLMYDAMVVFMRKDFAKASVKELVVPLAFSGLFMGIGIASKWTVAYGAVGLAVLLFAKMIITYLNERHAGSEAKALLRKRLIVCLWCGLFFIAVPFGIYFTAFLPQTTLEHHTVWGSFLNYQVNMFNYHATLDADHFFSSPWYEWPFVIKPIWYHVTKDLPGLWDISTISSMGNPFLWWSAVPAMLFTMVWMIRKKERAAFVAAAGFLSVYLPWIIVPRIAFIYHYFTAVPFLIIALMYVFEKMGETRYLGRRLVWGKNGAVSVSYAGIILAVFVAACLALFIVFFPVISGATTTQDYAAGLEWLPQWYFV